MNSIATMRVFVAGATGVIGSRLVPLMVAAGHQVAGMTRSSHKADFVRAMGAQPVICNAYQPDAVLAAVEDFGPEALMSQLTDLPDDPARIEDSLAATSRIRREGTRNLVKAAGAVGVAHFVSQSVAWDMAGGGGAAVEEMEQMVLGIGGVVVRYGRLYGPGTYYPSTLPPQPRVHVDTAASRTVPAVEMTAAVLTIIDD